jgi:hypothetical protein
MRRDSAATSSDATGSEAMGSEATGSGATAAGAFFFSIAGREAIGVFSRR